MAPFGAPENGPLNVKMLAALLFLNFGKHTLRIYIKQTLL